MISLHRNSGRAAGRSEPWRWVGTRALVLLLVSGITSTGCSFIWVTRPVPKEEAHEYTVPPPCSDSYWMPAVDTAAVALFVAAITSVSLSKSSSTSKATSQAIDGALSLTALASAIYGYHYVGKCKEERRALRGAESSFASQAPPGQSEQPVFPSPVAVQTRGKRMAVLEFQGRNMDEDILMTFSDTVRGGALQGLEPHGVVVMTRENMMVLLRDMGKKECGEGDCEVETARNIGADYVISGKVVRIEFPAKSCA